MPRDEELFDDDDDLDGDEETTDEPEAPAAPPAVQDFTDDEITAAAQAHLREKGYEVRPKKAKADDTADDDEDWVPPKELARRVTEQVQQQMAGLESKRRNFIRSIERDFPELDRQALDELRDSIAGATQIDDSPGAIKGAGEILLGRMVKRGGGVKRKPVGGAAPGAGRAGVATRTADDDIGVDRSKLSRQESRELDAFLSSAFARDLDAKTLKRVVNRSFSGD